MRTHDVRGAATVSFALAVLLTLGGMVPAAADDSANNARLNPHGIYLKHGTINTENEPQPELSKAN